MCVCVNVYNPLYREAYQPETIYVVISAENNPLNDYPDEEASEDDDDDDDREVTSGSSDEKSEGESTTSGSQSEGLQSGSQVSFEFEGAELYDWSDYGCDQTLEDCEGDEEHYW